MDNLSLKAGQVAAALNISAKRLQNNVDAGYLLPTRSGCGRGSLRQFSFEDVVRLQALEILVNAYGVAPPRAARMLAEVWPRHFSGRERLLVIRPESTVRGVKLEPIKLPLSEIAAAASAGVEKVLANYREKKRGRSAGWSEKFTGSLAKVSESLQGVSDNEIDKEIAAYRRARRAEKA
jgi:hypothetical protein